METDKNKHETTKHQTERQPGRAGAAAHNILERGTEAYVQAQKAVSDVYDRTASSVKKIKNYSAENPGKTILVTLGIGMGMGLLLGRSRTSRYTRPAVNALSDMGS